MQDQILSNKLFIIGLILSILLLIGKRSPAQNKTSIDKRKYSASSIVDQEKPEVDGKLNEKIWQYGGWETGFVQRQPQENAPPTEQTAFKILFDQKYLYIGIRNYDRSPSSISSRMSRRDGLEGDWVEVILDGNGDLRSAFSLAITAAGVKGDKVISLNGANEDSWWNPIWNAKSNIDEEGWTAEMRIPFSQLRFGHSENKNWGLQVRRKYFKNDETSVWQRVPLDASGWVSEFGELAGFQDVGGQKLLEIQPYIITSLKTFEKEPQNPYKSTYQKKINAGVDGKIGISNDLTLDFTINPDFGQVEADPSAIALDGFQLFFAEQRPFFVENKEIFNYQFSTPIIGSYYNNDNLFYSRRIGGKPHGSPNTNPGEFANTPERTTILGAGKFGGKTSKGLSVGVLETVTANEYSEISDGTETHKIRVEPLTNYFVGRVQQDLNNRNTYVGGILTSTIRNLDENLGSTMHKTATTAGLDFLHQWNNRSYYAGANLVMSQVQGSKKAIYKTQTSIPHLFQKPDARHVNIDTNKTSLMGTGGDLKIGKAGNGNFTFESGVTWRTPELELNDIGFMREADIIFHYTGVSYKFLKPFSIFRTAQITYQHWLFSDFGGKLNYIDWDVSMSGVFKNNWRANLGYFSQPHTYSRSFLQGGPRMRLPDQYGLWWGLGSDPRKSLSARLNGWVKTGNTDGFFLLQNTLNITYQPINKLKLSFIPQYTSIKDRLQYISSSEQESEKRFITARLDQKTMSFALRMNYTITPNLTIQYYAQPFISTGHYNGFNYVKDPLADSQAKQLAFFDGQQLGYDHVSEEYLIDENRDGNIDYQFRNPDFSFAQFQSNLVLRYEYIPGSEIFLVWSQGLTDYGSPMPRIFDSVESQLLNNTPVNNFLIKVTYRFY